jgi:Zn-finger nucleic acid-binding protein
MLDPDPERPMEAKTLHCQSCGAAVGADDLQCPYCRSQLATMACPKCFSVVSRLAQHCPGCGAALAQVQEASSALACPECRSALAATELGGVPLHPCHTCGGVWVAQKTFEQFAADRERRGGVMGSLPSAEAHPVRVETVRYRPCPQCAKLMNRQNYAQISGVVLDLCKDHGLWFDRDELKQVLEFIDGGGLEKSRARQVRDLEEQRRLATAAQAAASGGGAWADQEPVTSYHGPVLITVLESLVHLFQK